MAEVQRMLIDYLRACYNVTRRQEDVESAVEFRDSLASPLAELLAPADIQRGEKIGVWTRDGNNDEVCIVVHRSSVPHEGRLSLSVRRGTRASMAKKADETDHG